MWLHTVLQIGHLYLEPSTFSLFKQSRHIVCWHGNNFCLSLFSKQILHSSICLSWDSRLDIAGNDCKDGIHLTGSNQEQMKNFVRQYSTDFWWWIHSRWNFLCTHTPVSHSLIYLLSRCAMTDPWGDGEIVLLFVCRTRISYLIFTSTKWFYSIVSFPGLRAVCTHINQYDTNTKGCIRKEDSQMPRKEMKLHLNLRISQR